MRRLLLASVAFAAAGPALAADLPVKAPIRKAPIVDPWVGFYVGGNVGYSWGRINTTTSVAPFIQGANVFAFQGGTSSTSLRPTGVIAGGQAGYVGRIAPSWLAGIEVDYQWSGEKNRRLGGFSGIVTPISNSCTSPTCAFTDITDITAKLSSFGTLRLVAGPESNGLWVYGTVGLAVGTVGVSGINTLTVLQTAAVPATLVGLFATPFSYSKTEAGLSAGIGIQGLMSLLGPIGPIATNNLKWKVEYIHIDLASIGTRSFGGITLNSGRFRDDIVRIGFNYSLGDFYAPIVTRY